MPASNPTHCATPGCSALVESGYCGRHRPAARPRTSAARRGYGRAWRAKRLAYLRAQPLCRACEAEGRVTAAHEVDHIVPLSRGGADDETNYQPLCKACHSRKTAREA
jgi:5-methylcytosine-specific restriction protein A